ncbi:MAG: hypothetical protein JST87_17835 [Bacteroidetes bacterium]|nr:hypothetical protein [Bacteroidota bacterium]MBS1933620.1 hypothetical protein [Bacteroidota bacterium]
MDSLTLHIIHPAFEKLRRYGSGLHLLAALIILLHALSHVHQQESRPVYFWCQLIIATDILILVFAGRGLLEHSSRINLFFRGVEIIFFLGIGILMLMSGKWLTGFSHIGLFVLYCYLLYCEQGISKSHLLSIHHTGMEIPHIPNTRFFLWSNINRIEAHYDSIQIGTSNGEILHFSLRKNLDFDELEQIHEFCRHYLKS